MKTTQYVVRDEDIITNPLSRDQLIAIFQQCPPCSPLPSYKDPRWQLVWRNPVGKAISAWCAEQASLHMKTPIPVLTDDLYRDFARTGTRFRFEKVYFERYCRIAHIGVALLANSTDVRLHQAMIEHVEAIMAEESWALPAHVSSETGRDPQELDLFASETANLLAEYLSVYGDLVPQNLRERIAQRIRTAVYPRYLQSNFWWLSNSNNWNAVCNQGIVGAALTIEEDPELLADLVLRAARALGTFLQGFTTDGGCTEGPGYWGYGYGCFSALNQQLEVRSRGRLSLFGNNPHVRAIAAYGPAMCMSDGYVVNFSDCTPIRLIPYWLSQYLGDRLQMDDCHRQSVINYNHLLEDLRRTGTFASRDRLSSMMRLLLHEPNEEQCKRYLNQTSTHSARCVRFPDLGVWIASGQDERGNLWELAAKGGHNGEHHNHNDVGSFILAVNQVRFLTEIGSSQYTREYFRAERYTFLATRSLGHSIPIINGCEQQTGTQYRGTIMGMQEKDGIHEFVLDATLAYPESANCQNYTRILRLDINRGGCECVDHIQLTHPGKVESAFITHATDVTIVSDSVLHIKINGIRLALHSDGTGRWDRVEEHAYPRAGEQISCKRAVLVPIHKEDLTQVEFRLKMVLQ